ncbi:MAG: hypothetical protein K6E54_01060 [Bacteroidaceae bacterium]|nr:hypothetical protein [Bacteroidaceae bacterium]
MNINIRNRRRDLYVNVLTILVLTLTFFTFYFFMIQSSFGIDFNKSISGYDRTYVIQTFIKNDMINTNNKILNDLRHNDKVEAVTGYYKTSTNFLCIDRGFGCVNNAEVYLTTADNIKLFNPVVVRGKMDFLNFNSNNIELVDSPVTIVSSGDSSQYKYNILKKPKKRGVMICRSLVERMYGHNKFPYGRILEWYDGMFYNREKIIAIYEDFPLNSTLPNGIVLLSDSYPLVIEKLPFYIFVKLKEIDKKNSFLLEVADYMTHYFPQESKKIEYFVDNPKNYKSDMIRYDSVENEIIASAYVNLQETSYSAYPFGNMKGNETSGWLNRPVAQLSLYAVVFVVLMAFFCLMNIALTEIPSKMKSINTRFILGTPKWQIHMSIIFKYVKLSLISFVIVFLLIIRIDVMSVLDDFVITSFSLNHNVEMVFATFILALLLGLLVGIYVANYSTKSPMISVLKAKVGMDPQSRKLRNWLLRCQFAMTFAIVALMSMSFNSTYKNFMNSVKNNADQYVLLFPRMFYFSITCFFIIGVTMICIMIIEHRYMIRSRAIRKVLGTSEVRLLFMDISHYLWLIITSLPVGLAICAIFTWVCYTSFNLMLSFSVMVIGFSIMILTFIVIIPIILHHIVSSEVDIANSLKTE